MEAPLSSSHLLVYIDELSAYESREFDKEVATNCRKIYEINMTGYDVKIHAKSLEALQSWMDTC